jgi:hypothetical protein
MQLPQPSPKTQLPECQGWGAAVQPELPVEPVAVPVELVVPESESEPELHATIMLPIVAIHSSARATATRTVLSVAGFFKGPFHGRVCA